MNEYEVISDLHLGGYVTRVAEAAAYLRRVAGGAVRKLIVNGDLLDSTAAALPEDELALLDMIQSLHDGGVPVTWLRGNHDPHPEKWAHLLRVKVADSIRLRSGDRQVLVIHGHIWDDQLNQHPAVTAAAIWLGRQVGRVNAPVARWLKATDKMWRDLPGVVRRGAAVAAHAGLSDQITVICGHSHVPDAAGRWYVNEGAWCENRPPTYAAVNEGGVELKTWGAP